MYFTVLKRAVMSDTGLRPMNRADLEQVLAWRNHPDVRRFMYTTHEISLDEHRHWFERTTLDSNTHFRIYEKGGKAFGFIKICKTRSPQIADWGFYMSPDAPKGISGLLGNETLKYAFNELKLHKLCGQVLGFNDRSIAFHKRLGFIEEGRLREQHFDGTHYHDVVCFGLLAQEWQPQEVK